MSLRAKDVFRPARKRAPKAERESTIQRECVQWLIGAGCLIAITDAGMLAKTGFFAGCGIPTGWPDLTGLVPGGRFIGVECKTATGRQSLEQASHQEAIETRGGLYFLVRSVSDLQEQWARQNILDSAH